jgi:hypothetical protein
MQSVLALIGSHGTRLIAGLQGTLVALLGAGVIPDSYAKYMMAAVAVLTYWRGQVTSNAYDKGVTDTLLAPTPLKMAPIPPTEPRAP